MPASSSAIAIEYGSSPLEQGALSTRRTDSGLPARTTAPARSARPSNGSAVAKEPGFRNDDFVDERGPLLPALEQPRVVRGFAEAPSRHARGHRGAHRRLADRFEVEPDLRFEQPLDDAVDHVAASASVDCGKSRADSSSRQELGDPHELDQPVAVEMELAEVRRFGDFDAGRHAGAVKMERLGDPLGEQAERRGVHPPTG